MDASLATLSSISQVRLSFQRLSVSVLSVVCSSVCPCLPVVCLAVGKIFKIEKQMTWHKLTNPLLSPSAPQLCTCKYARFRLFFLFSRHRRSACFTPPPPQLPPHTYLLFLHILLHLFLLFLYTPLLHFCTCFSSSFTTQSFSSTSISSSLPLFHLLLHLLIPFYKLHLHCFPPCASIPPPLCNLPPPF